VLLEVLAEFGMQRDALKIIIAYGTHPPQSDTECVAAYGETFHHYPFIHHDCHDISQFIEMGRTSRNTPIRLRRDIVQASAVITMGAICHHYFAGYGGGRKLIFPGCGEKSAIYANHGLYLDSERGVLSLGCQPGVLENNPLAQDLFEIEKSRPADLAVHGILDSHGRLADLLVGRGMEDFLEGCRIHGASCEMRSPQYDLVIGSCGGFPKDINFIQSHKAMHNSAMFVKDGGLLLLYAECRDGIGSKTFLPWFAVGGFSAAFAKLAESYEGNGGTALATMTKTSRIRIGLISSLSDDLCTTVGLEKWSHEQVRQYVTALDGKSSIAIIPNASLLVRVDDRKYRRQHGNPPHRISKD
jgi:nickel-dependent lactate racemase